MSDEKRIKAFWMLLKAALRAIGMMPAGDHDPQLGERDLRWLVRGNADDLEGIRLRVLLRVSGLLVRMGEVG